MSGENFSFHFGNNLLLVIKMLAKHRNFLSDVLYEFHLLFIIIYRYITFHLDRWKVFWNFIRHRKKIKLI